MGVPVLRKIHSHTILSVTLTEKATIKENSVEPYCLSETSCTGNSDTYYVIGTVTEPRPMPVTV